MYCDELTQIVFYKIHFHRHRQIFQIKFFSEEFTYDKLPFFLLKNVICIPRSFPLHNMEI